MSKILLIVEDEQDLAEILEYNFKQEGYTVRVAHDGAEALQQADPDSPPSIDYNLRKQNYLNFTVPGDLITEGSSLVVTVQNIFESSKMTMDNGSAVDLTAFGTPAIIDGESSKLYLETKRLAYYE